MKKNFALCLTLAVLAGCDKDKFETKPQITIKSTSGLQIPASAALRITLEVTDKEGDVDDSLFVVRERLNRRGINRLVLPYKIPSYPAKSTVEVETVLNYGTELTLNLPGLNIPGSTPVRREIDTLRLKFVVKDRAGNKSDTAILEGVYVTR